MTARLESPWSYKIATPEQIDAQSNGIGPDRWPSDLRHLVTHLLGLYAPAARIHDWEFGPQENDGTLERWHEANARFHANCRALARDAYPVWRFLRRSAALEVADALHAAVESERGWKAWVQAWARNKQGAPTPG